ncbi:MAG: response regulator [Aliifodinibius sp.]|nr:response regulator transcription factor [candidate division Zixibacteria bacterium]NIT58063.1 response regulator transcription factor [Fodinibius sp.]NIS46632.1 response regulator transcription factor [candidate division Zixibacteria bacterium]NIU14751.1 response regulator transcription factor [candidate division Zixibacteria bacterium]NIV06752.1 response regulator [candidate division Zixibacteria bacterium]
MIRLLLVNEIRLMCNVLAAVLEEENNIEIVGCATSEEQALNIIQSVDVDIILTSTRLFGRSTLDFVEQLTGVAPDADILVLGVTERKNQVLQFVEAGASGYITRDSSVDELLDTIQATYHGKALTSPEITAALIDRLSDYARMFSDLETGVIEEAGLTPRELDVLELLGKNMTNQEIADALIIEVGTVKNHVHSILSKLDVNSRKEAATFLALINKKTL